MSLGKLAKEYHERCAEIIRLNREELRVSEQLKRTHLLQEEATQVLLQIAKNSGTQFVQIDDKLLIVSDSGITYKELIKVTT